MSSHSHSTKLANSNRPLSPHLQIYRWQLTSVMSILHRLAGIALSVGTVFLTFIVVALASGPESYALVQRIAANIFVQFGLFGWTLALYYHLCNGVRHLFWDAGYGFSLTSTYRSGYLVVGASLVLSILTWLVAFRVIPLDV
ncbi:MAG: succinate dehydrogenase, cytochrome b556 subunit [Candidatus Symbiobacter sp.]|nr:succinate dehydrogenase, cytochrome b556 subunit [Candidatus Symbiobacter sp.]